MEKQIIRDHWTYRCIRPTRSATKCCVTPSLTVPDLSLTIDELLVRYERGLPLPVQKTPIYEDENLPSTGRSVSTMDLIDLHYYKKSSMERLEILRDSLAKQVEANRVNMEKRKLQRKQFDEYIQKQLDGDKGASGTNTP